MEKSLVLLLLVVCCLSLAGLVVGCMGVVDDPANPGQKKIVLKAPALKPSAGASPEETVLINTLDTILFVVSGVLATALGVSVKRNSKLKKANTGPVPDST